MNAFALLATSMALFGGVAWMTTTWIRAKHGYPLEDASSRSVQRQGMGRVEAAREVARSTAERDAVIARLEQRVRVLERIVTDRPTQLRAEIERLREPVATGRLAS